MFFSWFLSPSCMRPLHTVLSSFHKGGGERTALTHGWHLLTHYRIILEVADSWEYTTRCLEGLHLWLCVLYLPQSTYTLHTANYFPKYPIVLRFTQGFQLFQVFIYLLWAIPMTVILTPPKHFVPRLHRYIFTFSSQTISCSPWSWPWFFPDLNQVVLAA